MWRMNDQVVSDESLMLRYAAGELAAFDQLYERHELRLWRFVFRSAPTRAIAEELLQEVWFAVAREAGHYRPSARFTTWLFTIARNRVIDHARVKRAEISIDADRGEQPPLRESLPDTTVRLPDAAAEASEQADAIIGAVNQLPAEQREVFLLQADGELSLEEIAAVTGSSFETTKSRLRYARSKLRSLLQEFA
jgi:RNA polymerase sigma-70 factor (ECF subfamily)